MNIYVQRIDDDGSILCLEIVYFVVDFIQNDDDDYVMIETFYIICRLFHYQSKLFSVVEKSLLYFGSNFVEIGSKF